MKTRLIKIIYVIAALILAYPYIATAGTDGLRQRLMHDSRVRALYAVDATHSFIIGKPADLNSSRDYTVVKWYAGDGAIRPSAYLVQHSPEPLMYKDPVLPSFDKVGSTLPASIRLTGMDLNVAWKGYAAIDVFEHAYAACEKRGGNLSFVVPQKYGSFKRLTLVSASEGFDYILLNSEKGTWYIACDGPSKFRILKNYGFLTGGVEMAKVREDLALEDVNYAADRTQESQRIARLERRPVEEERFLTDTARQLAALKMDFVKANSGTRYYGTYKNSVAALGCDVVSIKHHESGVAGVTKVYDYRVCSGKVAKISEKEINEGPAQARKVYVRSGTMTLVSE